MQVSIPWRPNDFRMQLARYSSPHSMIANISTAQLHCERLHPAIQVSAVVASETGGIYA